MHTVASNRVSARERELAPRYYYKVAEKTSCGQKIRRFVQVGRYQAPHLQVLSSNPSMQVFLTFMFTQVGVIVLIASYMVGGAFVFQHIEQDSLLEQAETAQEVSRRSVLDPSVGLRLTLDPDPQTENESEFRSKLNFEIGMLVRDIYSFASFFLHKIKQVSNKNKCRSRDF